MRKPHTFIKDKIYFKIISLTYQITNILIISSIINCGRWVPVYQLPPHILVGIHSRIAYFGQNQSGGSHPFPGQTTADVLLPEGSPWSRTFGCWFRQGNHPPIAVAPSLASLAPNDILPVVQSHVQILACNRSKLALVIFSRLNSSLVRSSE